MPAKKTPAKPITLNEEQREVVNTNEGYFQCLAGPGAGKTQVLVQRLVRLYQEGVDPNSTLSLTFTKTAAKNLRDRVEAQVGPITTTRTAGACTFHSLALAFACQERESYGFELAEFPLATEPVANKMLGESSRRHDVDSRALRTVVSLYRRRRVGATAAVRDCENRMDAKGLKLALAYKDYEKRAKDSGLLSFDDLIYYMVQIMDKDAGVRARWQYQYCMVDEAQDCCELEWDLVKLITEKHGNLLAVGDISQCQPPETMVAVEATCVKNAKTFPLKEVPISSLQTGDSVVTWNRKYKRLFVTPQKIEVSSRHYKGPMLSVHANGRTTRMTPDHRVWIKYAPHNKEQSIVYLMWKAGWGFRIGKTQMKKKGGSTGLNCRAYSQEADKAWVLKICGTDREALHFEELFSVQFNLPETMYPFPAEDFDDQQISWSRETFSATNNEEKGLLCLDAFGLLFDDAPYEKNRTTREQHARGYFKTSAANILPGFMQIPLPGEQSSALVTEVTRELYEGPVYSLEVEKEHTYSADGLVVANCIYGFRGSDPKLFASMNELFPGTQTLYLACNYRSTPEIVSFLRPIASSRELAEKFHTNNVSGPAPEVRGFVNSAQEAAWIISQIRSVC